MLTPSTLNIIGLITTLFGACIAASGVIIGDKTATLISATRWDQNSDLKKALIRQSRTAAIGLALVAAGTAAQLAAMFLR
jgi:hypothetical protein